MVDLVLHPDLGLYHAGRIIPIGSWDIRFGGLLLRLAFVLSTPPGQWGMYRGSPGIVSFTCLRTHVGVFL